MAPRPDGRLATQSELAQIFAVTAQTVLAWERRGCPVEEKGTRGKATLYNTASVIRWRTERAVAASAGDMTAIDDAEARRRKLVAEATLAEMEVALKRGELVPLEIVGLQIENEYSLVRANFMSMAGEIAADLEGLEASEIEEILSTKVSEILNGLSADGDFAIESEAESGTPDGTETTSEI